MNVLKEFPSEYITATDLVDAAGHPTRPVLTLRGIEKGSARDPKTGRDRTVPVLLFRGTPKKLRLNRSSMTMLVRAWGSESDNWANREVRLEVLATNLDDKTTGEKKFAVLVRPVTQKPGLSSGNPSPAAVPGAGEGNLARNSSTPARTAPPPEAPGESKPPAALPQGSAAPGVQDDLSFEGEIPE